MGGLRRWRILIIVFVFWVLFCWYWYGAPGASQVPLLSPLNFAPPEPVPGGAPSVPSPPPEGALTGDLRYEKRPDRHPVESPVAIPPAPATDAVKIPRIQATLPREDDDTRTTRLARLQKVKESFQHSWEGYSKHAWMHDEVGPLSGDPKDPFGGWAATLVDSLDSLWIMGLEDEFNRAVVACDKIDFSTSTSGQINVFETTIRYLGGFLGAYELSGAKNETLLKKAVEVGELLMGAFDTPNRMPVARWDWKEYVRGAQQMASPSTLVAEIGSLSLEFTKLSQLTKDPRYYDAIKRISDEFELSQDRTVLPGLWPTSVDAAAPNFHESSAFTIGGMADSLYEYLPKLYLLMGGRLDQPKHMYEKFIDTANAHIFWRAANPDNRDIVIAGDVSVGTVDGEPSAKYQHFGQHLSCFAGGMVGLASRVFDRPDDLKLATRITNGCVWAYDAAQNKIMPEIFRFLPCGHANETTECKWSDAKWREAVGERWGTSVANDRDKDTKGAKAEEDAKARGGSKATDDAKAKSKRDTAAEDTGVDADDRSTLEMQIDNAIAGEGLVPGFVEIEDRRYILRPEAIESIFIMWRLTGDRAWQDIAWTLFERIEALTRTDIAAAAVRDVTKAKVELMDSMESFWLAETLKYFALVFSEWDVVSLDEWVLNTEAHPLRRM